MTVVCAILLASAAASANRIRVSNQNIRIAWRTLTFRTELFTVTCEVTLEGTFHSATFPKTAGLLLGYITRAISRNETCANGRVWMLNGTEREEGFTLGNTLPWHFVYEGFSGTLPFFTSIRVGIIGMAYRIAAAGERCLYRSTPTEPQLLFMNREGGRTEEERSIPAEEESRLCPGRVEISGFGTLSVLGTVTNISFTLI